MPSEPATDEAIRNFGPEFKNLRGFQFNVGVADNARRHRSRPYIVHMLVISADSLETLRELEVNSQPDALNYRREELPLPAPRAVEDPIPADALKSNQAIPAHEKAPAPLDEGRSATPGENADERREPVPARSAPLDDVTGDEPAADRTAAEPVAPRPPQPALTPSPAPPKIARQPGVRRTFESTISQIREALHNRHDINILSAPTLMVAPDNEKDPTAWVFVGQEALFTYLEPAGEGLFRVKSTEPIELGLKSEIEIKNHEASSVELGLKISMKSLDGRSKLPGLDLDVGYPIVSARTLETRMRVALGGAHFVVLPTGPEQAAILVLEIRRIEPVASVKILVSDATLAEKLRGLDFSDLGMDPPEVKHDTTARNSALAEIRAQRDTPAETIRLILSRLKEAGVGEVSLSAQASEETPQESSAAPITPSPPPASATPR